jgi:outer membrane receptor protein involved in Fe transport
MKESASAAVLLSLVACGAALAVEPESTPDEDKALEPVVVTARKRSELLQEVPMSVVTLDTRELRERGIDDLRELADAVPGLQQSDLAITSRLSLRGVNSGDNNAFEQAVGVFVDGIYRGRMNQQHVGLFDLERIEVLKGPQVALYGNSSIGGAISAVTRKPRFTHGGDLQVGYETEYDTTRVAGGVDLPVSPQLAFRVAGTFQQQERGLAPNAATGDSEPREDHAAFRIGALWLPSDALSVGLRYERGRYERDGHIFDVYKHVDGHGNPWPNSPFTGLNDGRLDIANGAPFKHPDAFLDTDLEESMLQLDYDAGAFTLTSITGFSRYDYHQSADVDLTPRTLIGIYQDEAYRQFSQELRISGKATPRLSYLAGVYWQDDHFRNDYLSDFNLPALVAPAFGIDTSLAAQLLAPFSRHILLDQDARQSAVFANFDYALTERLTAGLGMRYQVIRKSADQAVRGAGIDQVDSPGALVDVRWLSPQLAPLLLGNAAYLADPTHYVLTLADGTAVGPVLAPNNLLGYQLVSAGVGVPHEFDGLNRREHHPMLQASLAFQQTPELLWYGRWSNGAKAGGFDFLYERGDRDAVEYGDERASAFEVGLKRDWPSVRLDLAAFYGRYNDLQVSVFDGGIGFVVGNAASSTSKGVEGELTWQIAPGWRTVGAVSYVDFRYRDFPDANCSTTERLNTGQVLCDWSGRRTPFVPKLETTLALEHTSTLGRWNLAQALRWGYKGRHATASDSEPQTEQRGYSLVDYRIEAAPAESRWSVAAYGRNLGDTKYNVFTSVIPLAPGGAFAYVRGPGREIGLDLRYRF